MATRTQIDPEQDYDISGAAANVMTILLAVVFLISGAYIGYVFHGAVKDAVANADVPSLPYVDLALPAVVGGGETRIGIVPQRGGEIPITGITGVPLPDYQKKERVNILLLGIDKRPDEQFSRTDTMILVTVNPENKTAGMLSIPRDLYVDIPGFDKAKINTAHYKGDQFEYPGGGPALAMQTVQQAFGVPVHFYIKVDFDGFYQIVDTLGGVEVDVPYAIHDDTFPDNNYGYDPFHIEAGRQVLDARTALKYVRSRHAPGSDFGRAARQQQVLVAFKDKALQLGVLPKIPELWTTMAGAVETNLQLVDIIELANLADEIGPEDIESSVLDYEYTVDFNGGPTVGEALLPQYDKIRPLIDSMFAEVEPNGPSQAELIAAQAAQATQEAQLRLQQEQKTELQNQLGTENATVNIQNGTNQTDLEDTTAQFLRKQGFNIIQFGPADQKNYPRTVIVVYNQKDYTLGTLVNFFDVAQENIRYNPNLQSVVDIRVIIGADFEMPEIPTTSTSMILK
jgi:LCP family protein required for cell wall assembly